MGIVVSMLLIAVGAVMRFAVTAEGRGFNVHSTGVVLLVVGIIGAMLSIGFWASWGGFNRPGRRNPMIGGQGTVIGVPGMVVNGQGTVVTGQRTTTIHEREVL